MPDHQIQKPNLFISHASSDGQFANVLKVEIEKVFADGVNVFCTSSPGAIEVSSDWLQTIENRLSTAQAVIVLITPLSIERSWLWFEVGASWLRARTNQIAIYPLCAPEIDFSDLPSPLDRLQALSMGKAVDLKLLFEGLIKQFGFGKIATFRASNITARLPKYSTVKIHEVDVGQRALYRGKYQGYSEDELSEVIRSYYLFPNVDSFVSNLDRYYKREEHICIGKLIHFRQLDSSLDLPPGTSKRLLPNLAREYALEPETLTDNILRLKQSKSFRKIFGRS